MKGILTGIMMAIALSYQAHAYELLMVQAVSTSKKTFVTRNGKRQGVVENLRGTFTANDVALIAKALTVTSQYTQWEVVNDKALVPFEVGTIVTYHPAQEYIWSLNPEAARKAFARELKQDKKRSWLVKGAMLKTLSETVSDVAPQNAQRGGLAVDVLFEKEFNPNIAWDVGLRYETEVVNVEGGSLVTERLLLLGDLLYYFDPAEAFYNSRVFIGVGLGYGQSSTKADGIVQSGEARLLPAAKMGMTLPFNSGWDFIIESAFETLQSSEKLEDNSKQTTNQSNLRLGIGIRHFF